MYQNVETIGKQHQTLLGTHILDTKYTYIHTKHGWIIHKLRNNKTRTRTNNQTQVHVIIVNIENGSIPDTHSFGRFYCNRL